jgi:hypothetical protein
MKLLTPTLCNALDAPLKIVCSRHGLAPNYPMRDYQIEESKPCSRFMISDKTRFKPGGDNYLCLIAALETRPS